MNIEQSTHCPGGNSAFSTSGLSLPLSEVLSSNISPDYFQIFYVYLFTGSLSYLTFVYCDLLREK